MFRNAAFLGQVPLIYPAGRTFPTGLSYWNNLSGAGLGQTSLTDAERGSLLVKLGTLMDHWRSLEDLALQADFGTRIGGNLPFFEDARFRASSAVDVIQTARARLIFGGDEDSYWTDEENDAYNSLSSAVAEMGKLAATAMPAPPAGRMPMPAYTPPLTAPTVSVPPTGVPAPKPGQAPVPGVRPAAAEPMILGVPRNTALAVGGLLAAGTIAALLLS